MAWSFCRSEGPSEGQIDSALNKLFCEIDTPLQMNLHPWYLALWILLILRTWMHHDFWTTWNHQKWYQSVGEKIVTVWQILISIFAKTDYLPEKAFFVLHHVVVHFSMQWWFWLPECILKCSRLICQLWANCTCLLFWCVQSSIVKLSSPKSDFLHLIISEGVDVCFVDFLSPCCLPLVYCL